MLLDDVTRCFSKVCKKKTYKNRVFVHTLLLDAEETDKRRKKKAKKKGYTQKMGGLQNGQEVVPPFFPKKTVFSLKPLFLWRFPKNGWQPFFFKRLCYKKDILRGKKKVITFCCLLDRNA